jgi:hypothetical protein
MPPLERDQTDVETAIDTSALTALEEITRALMAQVPTSGAADAARAALQQEPFARMQMLPGIIRDLRHEVTGDDRHILVHSGPFVAEEAASDNESLSGKINRLMDCIGEEQMMEGARKQNIALDEFKAQIRDRLVAGLTLH